MTLTTTYKGYKIIWSRDNGCRIIDSFGRLASTAKNTTKAKQAIDRLVIAVAAAWHVGQ